MGTRLSTRGNVELLRQDELDKAAAQLSREIPGSFYERFSQWFLADPAQRPASPF